MEQTIYMPESGVTAANFGRLFTCYRPRFEIIAYRYVRNTTVAEDLVSDSFIAFWENRGRIEPGTNLPAYILTIVKNRCLDWLRAQNIHLRIEQNIFDTHQRVLEADIRSLESYNPEELFSTEIAALVREALDQLPELTREVFMARRFSDMTYKNNVPWEFTIDMGATTEMLGLKIQYWGSSYSVSELEIVTSADRTTWKSQGILSISRASTQNVKFLKPVTARYVKYRALAHPGRSSVTEFNVCITKQ